jgi:hypothetical protein
MLLYDIFDYSITDIKFIVLFKHRTVNATTTKYFETNVGKLQRLRCAKVLRDVGVGLLCNATTATSPYPTILYTTLYVNFDLLRWIERF